MVHQLTGSINQEGMNAMAGVERTTRMSKDPIKFLRRESPLHISKAQNTCQLCQTYPQLSWNFPALCLYLSYLFHSLFCQADSETTATKKA